MGTLFSELGPHAGRLSGRPRIYADANVPAGLVGFMRARLDWDVLFVLEHADLRRARDADHYRLARQLQRTLLTLDRDYLDDCRFPPTESAGVLVISAPDERGLTKLLRRLDRHLFRRRTREPATDQEPEGKAEALRHKSAHQRLEGRAEALRHKSAHQRLEGKAEALRHKSAHQRLESNAEALRHKSARRIADPLPLTGRKLHAQVDWTAPL